MISDQGLNSIILDAKELEEKIKTVADFEKERYNQRQIKEQFSYDSEDEVVHSGKY